MTRATHPAPRAQRPLRLHVPGIIDVLLVQDPDQIRWLNQHGDVERELDSNASWLHRLINRRLLGDLAFARGALPVFVSRCDKQRALTQTQLQARLEELRGQPGEERDRIAAYVSGAKSVRGEEIGVMVQQWCGKLFASQYRSTRELYAAGKLLAGWPSSLPWRASSARRSGRLAKAKAMIGELASQDLHCIHATSIGMENITKTLHNLRSAAQSGARRQLSPDDILRQCLVAPPAVLRGCAHEFQAPFVSDPLTPATLIVFRLASAYASSGDLDDAFLGNSWSECPAREVVPEMLRSVWHAANHDAPRANTWLGKISSFGRRLRTITT